MRQPTAADGFSLIEALVAASVLIAGVAALVQLLMLAIETTHAAGDATRAAILAAQKAEELRSLRWSALAGGEEQIDAFVRRWSIEAWPPDVMAEKRELALRFKELATLRDDAPLFASVDAIAWSGPTKAFPAWAKRCGDPKLAERATAAARARVG